MSQLPPSPTSPPSSPPLSPTLKLVEQTEQRSEDEIFICYAETDDDVIAIHQFLLVVAAPAMRCPADPTASLQEVIRVTAEEVAIMAVQNGHLVGTLGLVECAWWYNPAYTYMADRWNFVLPQLRNGDVGRLLEAEAELIAREAGLEFINQGKIRGKRGKLMLMPRSSRPESSRIKQRA
jgi:GNAT superfamily N-acetyltransferase